MTALAADGVLGVFVQVEASVTVDAKSAEYELLINAYLAVEEIDGALTGFGCPGAYYVTGANCFDRGGRVFCQFDLKMARKLKDGG